MDYIMPLIPESIKSLPVHMDFHGQKRAEKTFQIIILLFGAVGFVWGYVCQQFSQTMYILLAGVLLSCIDKVSDGFRESQPNLKSIIQLTLPPWSMYRRNPLQWQKARPQSSNGDNTSSTSTPAPSTQQKSKKKK